MKMINKLFKEGDLPRAALNVQISLPEEGVSDASLSVTSYTISLIFFFPTESLNDVELESILLNALINKNSYGNVLTIPTHF